MKGIKKFLRNHFGFKTFEVNGFVGLIIIMIGFLFFNIASREALFYQPSTTDYLVEDKRIIEELVAVLEKAQNQKVQTKKWQNKRENSVLFNFDPNTINSEVWQKLGVKKYLAERIIKYRNAGGKFKSKKDLLKIYGFPEDLYQKMERFIELPTSSQTFDSKKKSYTKYQKKPVQEVELFQFNPNEIDAQAWQKLGVKKYLAERIVKYRNAGGSFKKKEDLLKIYGFPEDLYQKMENFIILPEDRKKKDSLNNNPQLTDNQLDTNKKKNYSKIEPQKFDINQADTSTLKQIRGIGSYFARKIIEHRDKLGGYHEVAQAKQVWNLKAETFEKLAQYAFVAKDFEVKKININTASVEELKNHIYLSYKLANTIVNYREQHGLYKSVNDLSKIHSINKQLLEKIQPYLKIE